jgi:hypothetical protein
MGWKAVKEALGIDRHIVAVTDNGICIGSGFVHDLVVIDPESGAFKENETFSGFVDQVCPRLREISPEQMKKLIQAPDKFEASVTVYTYEDGQILERQCEEPGYPNLTHDGDLMHDNTYSTDRDTVVRWAKRSARLRSQMLHEEVARLEQDLEKMNQRLAEVEKNAKQLDDDYPDIHE